MARLQDALNARTVLGILPEGGQAPTLGSIDVAFTTATNLDERVVTLTEPRLVASHFPTLDAARAAQVDERIRAALAGMGVKHVPLATLVVSLRKQVRSRPRSRSTIRRRAFSSVRGPRAGGSRFDGFGQLEQDLEARMAGGTCQHEFQSMRGGGGFAGRGGGGFRR